MSIASNQRVNILIILHCKDSTYSLWTSNLKYQIMPCTNIEGIKKSTEYKHINDDNTKIKFTEEIKLNIKEKLWTEKTVKQT